MTLGLGRSLLRLDRPDEALDRLREGRAIVAAAEGPDDPQVAIADRLIAEAQAASAASPDDE
jgi:hypothetical protein